MFTGCSILLLEFLVPILALLQMLCVCENLSIHSIGVSALASYWLLLVMCAFCSHHVNSIYTLRVNCVNMR